jgi:hypothetical protein
LEADAEQKFRLARAKAVQQQLVIIRPDSRFLLFPAMKPGSSEMLASLERLLPSCPTRNAAVIADTAWSTMESPSLQDASRAIPFLGMLVGFTSIGHVVWVFDGRAGFLSAGCREADLLIVDGALLAEVPPDWETTARKVIRNPQILVHERATFKLRRLD